MEDVAKYYVVTKKAIPEVLIRVVNAKKLLDSGRAVSVQEATDAVGISRSSFYKYKDDIFPFHESAQGTTITLSVQINDEPGLLSELLKIIADFKANILTIHQSIPIDGVASLNISLQILNDTGDISDMIESMENKNGVHYVKILGRE